MIRATNPNTISDMRRKRKKFWLTVFGLLGCTLFGPAAFLHFSRSMGPDSGYNSKTEHIELILIIIGLFLITTTLLSSGFDYYNSVMRRQLFTISDATEDQHSGRGARIVLRIPNQNDFNVEEYIIYDPSQRTSIIRSSLSRPSRSTTDGSSRSRSNQEETSNLMPPSYESLSNSNNTNTANAVDDISESPPDYESAINIENSRNQ